MEHKESNQNKQKSQRKIKIIFKHVFWALKRTLSLRRSFEYPKHMFWLKNKKIIFSYALLFVYSAHLVFMGCLTHKN